MTGSFARGAVFSVVVALLCAGHLLGCGGASPAADASGGAGMSGAGGASDSGAGRGGATGGGGASGAAGTTGGAGAAGTTGGAGAAGTTGGAGAAGAAGGAGANGGAGAGRGGAGGGGGAAAGAAGTGAGTAGAAGSSSCGVCAAYGTPARAGQTPSGLDNLSGIATSWRNPGVLFAHNDMTQAQVFALAGDGQLLARFALASAGAVDIEDIGVGPCPAGTCVYLADIGGNLSASRVEFAIYRITEPAVATGGSAGTTNVSFERFRFAYPDGANHNAESLVIDPTSGALYIITKVAAGQPSTAYALPHPPSATAANTLRKVADLPVPRSGDSPATAASAHPCGRGFLLRTNNIAYEFRIAAGAPFESAFNATPTVVPTGSEPQSEAISYRPDGKGYVSSGETAGAPIFSVGCN